MYCLPTDARTLCEIDTAHGWSKGNAFRLFKRLAESAREGQDYWVFPPHSSEFTALRARLYPGSQRAILLSRTLADRLSASD